MYLPISIQLLLSFFIGAFIGLERESYEKRTDKTSRSGIGSLGIRSYILITTLGTLTAFIGKTNSILYLIVSLAFIILLIAYYILGSLFTKDNGLTSELAVLWSFIIGSVIGLEVLPIQLVIAMVIILTFVMTSKQKIKLFVHSIKEHELNAFISYAIIALVILPFLPDVTYTLKQIPLLSSIFEAYKIPLGKFGSLEILNPFGIWKIVVLITGIEVVGYILEKTIGQQRGWLLTSIAGGFISSTSTTQSLAQQSKKTKNIERLVAAALFANLSSFLQHFILLASINSQFLVKSTLYILSIFMTALILGIYFLTKSRSQKDDLKPTKKVLKDDSIFSLGPALRFALLFLFIKLMTKTALFVFGNSGFLISNLIAAFTGLDAVTINISELVGKQISYRIGVIALICANASNLFSKSFYVFLQGNRKFAIYFFISVVIIVGASFIGFYNLT